MKKLKPSKKTTKKIKSTARGVAKKAKVLMRVAKKEARKTVKVIKKEWKKQQPQREIYIRGIKKMSGDVLETIKKDAAEIRKQSQAKKKNK